MNVRIKKRENPYLQIDKTAINDESLSPESLGVLTYLLSKPDNWKAHKNEIYKRFSNGKKIKTTKNKVDTIFSELKALGYVKIVPVRGANGELRGSEYEVSEVPTISTEMPQSSALGESTEMPQSYEVGRFTEVGKSPTVGDFGVYNNNDFSKEELLLINNNNSTLNNNSSSEKILSNFSETEILEKKEILVEAKKEEKVVLKKVAPKKEKKEKAVDPRTRPQLHDSFIKIYDDFHKRMTNTVIPNSKWSQQVTGIKGLRIAIIESVENFKSGNKLTPPTDNEVLKTFEGFLKKAWAVSNEFHQSQFSPNHLNTNFIQFTNKIKNNNNGKSNSNNNQTDKLTTEQRQTLNTYKPAQPVYASADFAV